MLPDPFSFSPIPGAAAIPENRADQIAGGTAFAALYTEAMEAANRELAQIVSSDSPDSGSTGTSEDPISFLESRMALSALSAGGSLSAMGEEFSAVHDQLMQQVAAIGQRQAQAEGAPRPSVPSKDATNVAASPGAHPNESGFSFGIHRLISWIDTHAHLHSTHQCAASVRQAMEAAGIPTVDRPSSGDAGDYGPFLLHHGAQVIAQESYEPKAGDIAVFDRTGDHPAGHIQVFDGQRWVSDFVQHTFSPYRDQESTPPVTVYRLS